MDFWAQHKSFVLKVLAGLGVFLVALIIRAVMYGDDLENALAKNRQTKAKISRVKLLPRSEVRALNNAAAKLKNNARSLAAAQGYEGGSDSKLQRSLIRSTLGYLRRYAGDEEALNRAADVTRTAIRENLNGGFGQLRLTVQDEFMVEANELNVTVEEMGFSDVTALESEQLVPYLIQLELVARVLRACIDERVDAVQTVRVSTRAEEAIPGANPAFLREQPVAITFRASQAAAARVLNRLDSETVGGTTRPAVPIRKLKIERQPRPANHVDVSVQFVPLAANTEAPFAAPEQEDANQ